MIKITLLLNRHHQASEANAGNLQPNLNYYSMIKEVSGDIMLSKAQVIAHGVAPHDHFDNGLALSLRQDYPS